MLKGQSGYGLCLEWLEFCTHATKASTLSKGLTPKMNDKPKHIYLSRFVHNTVYFVLCRLNLNLMKELQMCVYS
jgi:hypothetical protein